MRLTIGFFVLGYMLSQFYRACLAVLTPVLKDELGATAGDLALALGLWYVTFALMQIPVGEALDRIGPRRTSAALLAVGGGGGAAMFAVASGPLDVQLAMALIGIGCSPVLMGSYYIFARSFRPALFGTLAASIIGVGSLGNLLGATPLAAAVEAFGWRETLWALTAMTLAVSAGLFVFVRDPERVEAPSGKSGTILDVLKIRGLWLMLPLMMINYTASAGIRGIWAGPYLADIFGADAARIGTVTLAMGVAMTLGNFMYGPADRLLGSHRRVAIVGNAGLAVGLVLLWLQPDAGLLQAAVLLAMVGLLGQTFPVLMAHGRAFIPPHLTGRGVSLLNMFSILGVSLMQFGSRAVFERASETGTPPEAYSGLFLFFLVPLLIGLSVYVFSRDNPDATR